MTPQHFWVLMPLRNQEASAYNSQITFHVFHQHFTCINSLHIWIDKADNNFCFVVKINSWKRHSTINYGGLTVMINNHKYKTVCVYIYIYIYISGGPLSALTCCVNVRLLSAIKKISPLIYSQSWVGSWVYTTQAMMTFTLIF